MKKTFTLALCLGVFFCVAAQKTLGEIERLDPEINSLIAADAVIEILADGFSWAPSFAPSAMSMDAATAADSSSFATLFDVSSISVRSLSMMPLSLMHL